MVFGKNVPPLKYGVILGPLVSFRGVSEECTFQVFSHFFPYSGFFWNPIRRLFRPLNRSSWVVLWPGFHHLPGTQLGVTPMQRLQWWFMMMMMMMMMMIPCQDELKANFLFNPPGNTFTYPHPETGSFGARESYHLVKPHDSPQEFQIWKILECAAGTKTAWKLTYPTYPLKNWWLEDEFSFLRWSLFNC